MREGVSVQFVDRVSANLPSQRQPPALYPISGIIIPQGAKSDELGCLVIREYLLHTFIESLGKYCQILGGIEPGAPQLL